MVGFALVIVLLTAGMGFALRRMQDVTSRQLVELQAEHHENLAVEDLRQSGEVLVSEVKSYLISGSGAQYATLQAAMRQYDASVSAIEGIELTPVGKALVEITQGAAMPYREIQTRIVRERRSTDMAELVEEFERELLPARIALRTSLDQLVRYKSQVMDALYDDANEQRERLNEWLYGLLATLVLVGTAVAWLSARRLDRLYRREAEAVTIARKALGARDEVMGIIAHDLRSPLGAITMRSELLHDQLSEPAAREHAAAINNTATRMGHLIKSMLDVSVLESGQLTIRAQRCAAEQLVTEAIEMFSVLAASKNIQLESTVVDHGLVVEVDRERMIQVLANLLGNALKFTPRGGRVSLMVERHGDFARFIVSDTGIGISAANLPRIFDRYWKDEKRGTKGTGLGLYIAKGIIDAHGGQITAESPPDQGATFRFDLPLASSDRRGEVGSGRPADRG